MQRAKRNEFIGISTTKEAIERLFEMKIIWTDSMIDMVTGSTHFYRYDRFIATHSIRERKLIIAIDIFNEL